MSEQRHPKEAEIVNGLRVCRRPIFSARISTDGWQRTMLIAMASCRALGVSTFEIQLSGDPTSEIPKKKQGDGILFSIFGPGPAPTLEGDEWKVDHELEKDGPKKGAAVVTVYAVVVE